MSRQQTSRARTAPVMSQAERAGLRSSAEAIEATHPQDRVYSGLFGHGQVVELLLTPDGYAYGHRISFESGVEAELLITELAARH